MNTFTKEEIVILFLSLSIMLGLARILGDLFSRFKLPAVIGQILAGILLGHTVLGRLAPDLSAWLFPSTSSVHTGLEAFILLGVVLLLLTAGLEVDLSSVFKQGKSVIFVSIFSIMTPFLLGATVAWFFPHIFGKGDNRVVLSLFIGIAVSITALPIIAKILMDMKLFHSDLGMLILSAAIINDIFGWLLFSVLIQVVETGNIDAFSVAKTVGFTLVFSLSILTVFRYLINMSLGWIQAKTEWPGGVITFAIVIALLFSALAEAIGIHAIFGAFLAGIAIGDSPRLKEHTREIIDEFINNIFAPLFFVAIGLRIDFIGDFNFLLSLLFIVIVFTGKLGGSLAAGYFSKMKIRESFAIGSGMSASGAMGIILGLFALQFHLISGETYVSIVVTAVVTSMFSGPMIKFFLKSKEVLRCIDLVDSKLFISSLKGATAEQAIMELSKAVEEKTGISQDTITRIAMEREAMMSTGLGNLIAVPHARLFNLKGPVIAIGISKKGIDFNAPDGKPAHIIFLILSRFDDQNSQIQILSDISNIFITPAVVDEAIAAKSYTDFISVVKTASHTASE